MQWDAWRREDGRWTLVADYRSGERTRHAEFVFDAPGRYVVAEDDEARWLVGEATSSHGPQPRQPGTGTARRLSAVPSDEELPLGEDAIDLVSDRADDERTVDLGPAARAVRAAGPADPSPTAPSGDADWIATQATDRPTPPADDTPADEPEQTEPTGQTEPTEPTGQTEEAEQEPVAEPDSRAGARAGGRASVPSWDEIMFGGGKRE